MPLPRLVLVPGLLNDADLWRDQISALAPIATPVVADITQGSSLPELVDAVLKVGGDRFALAGFSLGGIVAQQVMQAAPERVSHLALLSTTMLPDTPDRAAERDRLTALLTEIPVAMILVNPQHQIVLYDGQAAEALASVDAWAAEARLANLRPAILYPQLAHCKRILSRWIWSFLIK